MNNNGNGHKSQDWRAAVEVKENPFLSPRTSEPRNESAPAEEPMPFDAAPALSADADLPPSDPQVRTPRRRNLLILCFFALSLTVAALAYYALNGGRKIEYRVAERKAAKAGQQAATGIEQPATDQMTADAINQAKEELRKSGVAPAAPAIPEAAPTATASEQEGAAQRTPIFTPYIVPDAPIPTTTPKRANGTSDSAGDEVASRNSRQSYAGRSQTAAHSIYVEPARKEAETRRGEDEERAAFDFESAIRTPRPAIAPVRVPSFGSLLPVRTLGAVFTLRNSLVRLETTRDIEGDGWRLTRGTVLVAQQQGSDADRAFLTLMGFIDPATNRFVKLGGDLIGSDGAPGLKGKRRQINSRWTRVFSRLGSSAVQLGQAALARGNTTIIMPGGVGSDFGFNPGTIARREFVEIPAGAVGYVMITDLPKETRGADAEPAKTGEDFLADEELAELLSTGKPEQIRAALPRMQPEMRKIALLALGERDR
jgi:hypothetical protein